MKKSDNDREGAIRNRGYFHEQLKLMATEEKRRKTKHFAAFCRICWLQKSNSLLHSGDPQTDFNNVVFRLFLTFYCEAVKGADKRKNSGDAQ